MGSIGRLLVRFLAALVVAGLVLLACGYFVGRWAGFW